LRRQIGRAVTFVAVALLLSGCANPQVQVYRKDPHAYLKELVYCENNWAELKDTPNCQAAMQINEEMFPGWHP
jgi:hypothetical protein